MRKDLGRKYEQHQAALENKGAIIDEKNSLIYRLAVAPDGWCRVALNDFVVAENTVLGPAKQTWDVKTSEEAIALFEEIKIRPGMVWREDDRVFYDSMKGCI